MRCLGLHYSIFATAHGALLPINLALTSSPLQTGSLHWFFHLLDARLIGQTSHVSGVEYR